MFQLQVFIKELPNALNKTFSSIKIGEFGAFSVKNSKTVLPCLNIFYFFLIKKYFT